ncbi:MAG: DNA primase [Deltaproteobacteria bacterium]|nr:DNA primase [Deltaproteobacteria bacterium]
MARIPERQLEQLKRLSLAALVEASGIALSRRGANLAGLCPFHEEDTPSLIITVEKNLFHCFGCDAGGGPIDWIMRRENLAFREAVALLSERAKLKKDGTKAEQSDGRSDGQSDGRRIRQRKRAPSEAEKSCPLTKEATGNKLLTQVASFYHEALHDDDKALALLEERGLNDERLIEHFQLGACNRSLLGTRLPTAKTVAGDVIRLNLLAANVTRKTGHEQLGGCLVVPFYDAEDKVAKLYGRKTGKWSAVEHLYLAGPHAGILNRADVEKADVVVLCEAPLDALSFWVSGVENVTCSFGASTFTDELLLLLASKKRVLVAFDADKAGDEGLTKLKAKLEEQAPKVAVERIRFAPGYDANDVLVRRGKAELASLVASFMASNVAPIEQAKVAEEEVGMDVKVANEPLPLAASALQMPVQKEACDEVKEEETANEPSLNAPSVEVNAERDEVHVTIGKLSFRVRGLKKNVSFDVLKVNVRVMKGDLLHVDNFDLYGAKSRSFFAKSASMELHIKVDEMKRSLGRLMFLLEEHQENTRKEREQPKVVELSPAEKEEAMKLLMDPHLLLSVLEDFETVGVTGEETNKLVGFLASISRKLDKPLAIMVQSSSAAGKSSLMDAVLSFVPDEDKVAYSAMTGQSLFYMADGDLRHKVLAVAEEEGAERASYALKILQSEGKLCIASTGKDVESGRLVTSEYEVEGPVAIFTTTTAIDVDEELLNRCLVLTVDEDGDQTTAIYAGQRSLETHAGLGQAVQKEAVLRRQRNAQRLLLPLQVVNPYALNLTFPNHLVRLRRDHAKYLTLLRTIALTFQHQRPLKTLSLEGQKDVQYVEVELSDIDLANALMQDVLGRSLDELAPQTRKMLGLIEHLVQAKADEEMCSRVDVLFTRQEVRSKIKMSSSQLHLHLTRLVELEYLFCTRRKGERSLSYGLIWSTDDDNGMLQLTGLSSAAEVRSRFMGENPVEKRHNSPQIRPQFAAKSALIRTSHLRSLLLNNSELEDSSRAGAGKPPLGASLLPPTKIEQAGKDKKAAKRSKPAPKKAPRAANPVEEQASVTT